MCSRTTFVVVLFVLVRLADFTGDGFIVYKLMIEWISQLIKPPEQQLNQFSRSNVTYDSTYCRDAALFLPNADNLGISHTRFTYSLWAYVIIAVFSLLAFPPLVSLSMPPNSPADLLTSEDDDISIDYDFRMKESGGKRSLRYTMPMLMVIIHDIPLAALATSMVTYLISPDSLRCASCVFGYDSNNCGPKTFAPGWNDDLVFPIDNDYYWLILIGGKVFGALGSISLVLYLEFQYRYQIHVLKAQRREQMIRRHFGPSRARKNEKIVCLWFASLVASFVTMVGVVAMTFAPALTIIQLGMSEALQMLEPRFQNILEYLTYACWAVWVLFIVAALLTVCVFGFCRKKCKRRCCC